MNIDIGRYDDLVHSVYDSAETRASSFPFLTPDHPAIRTVVAS